MTTPGWFADLQMGNIFRVDSETDLIGEDDVFDIWPQCDEGGSKEVGQFVGRMLSSLFDEMSLARIVLSSMPFG